MSDQRNPDKHSPFETQRDVHTNLDPITGAPGAHPVGAGIGAIGGAAAGAAIGTAAGPLGTVVGAAIGGVTGGLVGKGVAEGVNPTEEHIYWQNEFKSRPYYAEGTEYSPYGRAYQYGWESQSRYDGRSFKEMEPELERTWNEVRSERDFEWNRARPAVQDAWLKMDPRGGKTA